MANTLIFLLKNIEWVAFAFIAKAMHIFCSKNTIVFENTLATTVNEVVINELVKLMMLWSTGPCILTEPWDELLLLMNLLS